MEKKQFVIPYKTILSVEPLQKKLQKLKGVHTVSRHYWMTFGEVAGSTKEYPTLYVFSTSISQGVLLGRKFEKILVSPENKVAFIKELESRVEVLQSAEM
ncbi:MAG: PH domain-containing protein [Bacillus sp. (in: Bacteria)]|nr:PH domain-containing protein [Bacillus sp. (in: firmicutes)]